MRALDLFCCAGGAGKGLANAGFEVVGVDINPQPNYPFEFHQADALTFPTDGFDFIWASPPCQAHTALKTAHNAKPHIDLIPETREKLKASGLLWAMENVPGAPLIDPIRLCGEIFQLKADEYHLRRHRMVESNFEIRVRSCQHTDVPVIGIYGGHARCRSAKHGGRGTRDFVGMNQREMASKAMGIDWMTLAELSQAIPPAYSELVGRQALRLLGRSS